MNTATMGLAALRAASFALSLVGQPKIAQALDALASAAEAGVNVDAHMADVAQLLKDRAVTDADWADVLARIQSDSDRLQGVKTS